MKHLWDFIGEIVFMAPYFVGLWTIANWLSGRAIKKRRLDKRQGILFNEIR